VRRLLLAAACCAAPAAAIAGTGFSGASYTSSGANPGTAFTAAADWTAPTVSASVIAKSAGGTAGAVRAGGSYFVYANVADSGNPASGTSTVAADASALTAGATATAMTSGSFSVGGVSYGYRSGPLTVGAGVTAGTKAYGVTTVDAAGNTATRSDLSVTVDNTAPAGADVQSADGGGTTGQPQAGDRVILTYTEPLEPSTVLAGWDGSATNVVVRMNGGTLTNNVLTVWNAANSSQLPLGSVDLGSGAYAALGATFGASGTPSTIAKSGSTITVTLGTASLTLSAVLANTTMKWTPASGPTDIAGNGISTAQVTESGAGDRDF
jgi:hypothetical protein